MNQKDKLDLVIRGGKVVDPSQSLAATRDVGIKNGRIAAVDAAIAADRAREVIDAGGKLVMPGIVDLHAHVYPYGSAIGIPADELVPFSCTTTVVSAGDAGANNFAAFRRHIVAQSRTRLFAFVHIANHGLAGFPVPEMLNLDHADVEAAARAVVENQDIALGIKVRQTRSMVGENGLTPLRRAIEAAELAGGGARVMCHIGDVPQSLSALLDLMRPGDIVTHAFSGVGNNIVQDGKVLAAALAAKARGVIIDVGHGAGSFDYAVAEPAFAQGLVPDTLSSDIHVFSSNSPGRPYMPWVMSKFLNLGFSLEQVVAMSTTNPARIIGRVEKLGTLQVGAPADVAIMELIEGAVRFVDTRNNVREGSRWLKPVQTIRGGVPFGGPYQIPFAVG
ncbi:MAG TPA: amidohydrolase/deacetylase family metallohydrolase [Polyangia bacterium]|nr:amidohydrolase/deacetylase family metallohydrolase [Polyangia bacterium]